MAILYQKIVQNPKVKARKIYMNYQRAAADLVSPRFKLRHYTSPNSFPLAFLTTISHWLMPRKGRASKSKLYYQLRTAQGQFYISPTGSLIHFSTYNSKLELQLKYCMRQKDTLQAYISYSAGDCIDELNDIFVELVKENCRYYSFLKRLIDFLAARSIWTKLALELFLVIAGTIYCVGAFSLIKWMLK